MEQSDPAAGAQPEAQSWGLVLVPTRALETNLPDNLALKHRAEVADRARLSASGPLDRAVAGVLPQLRTCYVQATKQDPMLAGKVTVSIKIAEDGMREVRTLENTTGSSAIARCVERRFRAMRVEATDALGAVSSVYPLLFHADRRLP